MMLQKHHLSAPRRHDQETRLARDTCGSAGAYDFANAGNGFQRARCPKRVPGGLPATMSVTLFPVSTRRSPATAMADARTILSCNDGSNITRKALFKETAYCQALWITILEVAPKHCPIFRFRHAPALQSGAVSNTMRSSLRRAIRALMPPHPRRNGKKIFSLKCSNALHSRARKPPPGE